MKAKGWIWGFVLSLVCMSSLLVAERVTLREGTPIRVRLKADLTSERAELGNRVDFEVVRPMTVRGLVVIPEGAVAWGAVQSVKKKEIKFDIQGVRLPNLQEVKLRSIREKTKNPGKDQLKIETEFGQGVGAPRGSEFTAYVDDNVEVEGAPEQPATVTAPPPQPAPAPVTPVVSRPAPAPQPAAPTPVPVAPPTTPAVSRPMPAPQPAGPSPTPVAQPTTPAPAPPPPRPAPRVQEVVATGERVTVECFSDPLGADILLDGDFVGSTPSILKVAPGNHRLEIQMAGYKTFSQPLNLPVGTGIQTIRATLEKKE